MLGASANGGDGLFFRSFSSEGADPRQVADPRKRAGMIEKTLVGGDEKAIQFNGEGKERGVVKREAELTP